MAESHSGHPPTYSFLVQSSSSSMQDVAINFEGATSKQKRKRTSTRDHAILEAAYQKNSKPDKNERADIVSQVELSEKEVQIWFQNRRQNDRRKAKPLQPHELLAHIRNNNPTQTSTKLDGVQISANPMEPHLPVNISTTSLDLPRPPSRSSSLHELLNPSSSGESVSNKHAGSSSSVLIEPLSTPPSSYDEHGKKFNETAILPPTENVKHTQHSRKRSHDVMASSSAMANNHVEQTATVPQIRPALAKQSSFVRLAMTADGAVKIRTNNETTPSPPKKRQPPPDLSERRNGGLQRCRSGIERGLEFKDINPPIRQVGQAGFGRSRDTRTWEFYCDRDSSEALSTQVEAERNGSAIGAINLIRSNSQRNKMHALSPNAAKQNMKHNSANHSSGKPKLARARSSMARLQNFDGALGPAENKIKRPRHGRSPSGDSDKENWAPGTRDSQNSLRRIHPSTSRLSVLRESGARPALMEAESGVGQEQEHGIERKEKAKGDDLDCIQGLLSLSQGAWR